MLLVREGTGDGVGLIYTNHSRLSAKSIVVVIGNTGGIAVPYFTAMPECYGNPGAPPRRSSAVLRMVSAISGLLLDNIWKSTA